MRGRYPTHLIDVVQRTGAWRVTLRPVLPQDAELQRRFFRALSAADRYRRFMTPLTDLRDDMAQRFSDVDHAKHLALLACTVSDAGEAMIGEARCVVVDARQPPVGDFAIAVAGDWQRRGLGRILLSRLISHAAASGISRLVANTLAGNAGMVALAERCGFAALPERSDRQLRASSGSCRQQMCTGSMTCGRCVA
ncbi:MAG TPA: GNAT family N-acetyltransferase [Hyphomicrobiaceae bacterium]|jgi:acetyltransferase|nr:GNAT family N-acetyltransferase [Hyphomicrobiaceae bacterium]